jgi:O-antigen/teichoic acid export membrane protein
VNANLNLTTESEPEVTPLPQSTLNEVGTVASGTFWNALNLAISLPLGILSFSLISHALGANAMGQYNFAIWLNAVITGLLVGTANTATKYIAELRGKAETGLALATIRWLLKVQGLIACGLLVLAVLLTWFAALVDGRTVFSLDTLTSLGVEYILPIVAAAFTLTGGIFVGVAQAERRFRALCFNNITFAVIQIGLIGLALWQNWQVAGLLVALVGSSLVYLGLNWRLVQSLGLLNFRTAPKVLPPQLRHEISGYLWSVAGTFALSVVVWQDSEVFFLKIFSAPAEISYYSAAFVLASRLILLPDLVFAAFLPVVCSLYAQTDFVRLNSLHRQTLRYLLILSTPIAVGGIILANPIQQLLNGATFAPAALPLALLLFSSLLIAPGKLAVAILMAANDRQFIRNLTLLAAGLNLGLAALLVGLGWGAVGAALASVLAQLGVLVTITRASSLIQQKFPWLLFGKNILTAVLAFGVAWLCLNQVDWLHLILAAVVGGLLYLGLLPILGLVGRADWQEVRNQFKLKKLSSKK